MMIMILGGVQAIPGELNEAAEVDGASAWRRISSHRRPAQVAWPGPTPLLSPVTTW